METRNTAAAGHGVIPPARRGTYVLGDGRRLGWAEWGPVDGVPVLLCPGAGTGREFGFGAGVLHPLGVRLISVDRPGLGASDPWPSRTLTDWARDIEEFAAGRGLDGPAAVGFSAGGPFALACAAAGVVTGVAVVSGTDELAAPGIAPLLAAEIGLLVDAVATDPAGAEASFHPLGADPDVLRHLVLAVSSAADRAVYTEPFFQDAYRRALADGLAQGPSGYARDTALTMSPWPFDPEAIKVPVDLWYGMLDVSPVHSPDLGASLELRIPTARRHVVPDAGAALLWTHAGDVLRGLLARIGRPAAPAGRPRGRDAAAPGVTSAG
ncbi:alpha/beta fold hydrolase [Sphaerisporangium rufum]|nr:alpha/beta hydrolase [Sphaerisporangium rufum]